MLAGIVKAWNKYRLKCRSLRAIRIRTLDFGDLGGYCATCTHLVPKTASAKTLDIGCGEKPRNPFNAEQLFGVDIREDAPRNIKHADLTVEPIPYPDAYFDFVTAFDFIEHVPRVIYLPSRRFPFVELMNEIHRVLKIGGMFLSHTPAYPFAQAFRDPTHVNIITEETFPEYFGKKRSAYMYGFNGSFEITRQGWIRPCLVTVMKKKEPPF